MQNRFRIGGNTLRSKTREELIVLRRKFEKREQELRNEISYIEREISSEFRQKFALSKATTETYLKQRTILREEVNKALAVADEFNYPFYGPYLLQAIEKRDIINVRLLGSRIHIDIRMNAAAGTLANYGVAVDKARKDLGVSKKTNPQAASYIWRYMIYAAGRQGRKLYPRKVKNKKTGEFKTVPTEIPAKYLTAYVVTVEKRLSYLGENHKASWWELLDKGNVTIMGSHSRGGTPYPSIGATNFKKIAENRILILVEDEYQRQLAKYTDIFRKRLDKLEKLLNSVLRTIRRIEDLLQGREEGREDILERRRLLALDLIKQQLEEVNKLRKADTRKIEELARRLAQGEQVDRIRVGGETRIRTLNILNQLDLEFGKW